MGGKKCDKPCSVFGLRPSVSFCSASAKNFHFGESLIRAVQLIEFDSHAHLVSKASSVIGSKSPSPVFKCSSS